MLFLTFFYHINTKLKQKLVNCYMEIYEHCTEEDDIDGISKILVDVLNMRPFFNFSVSLSCATVLLSALTVTDTKRTPISVSLILFKSKPWNYIHC